MPFERFIPVANTQAKPKATIRPSGLISFDATAVEAFGLEAATHAVVFFDKTKKLVGIKPTRDGSEEGAIPLNKRRRSMSLRVPSFFERYAISLPQPQRFDVSWDEASGLVVINLKSVHRKRGRRPRSQS